MNGRGWRRNIGSKNGRDMPGACRGARSVTGREGAQACGPAGPGVEAIRTRGHHRGTNTSRSEDGCDNTTAPRARYAAYRVWYAGVRSGCNSNERRRGERRQGVTTGPRRIGPRRHARRRRRRGTTSDRGDRGGKTREGEDATRVGERKVGIRKSSKEASIPMGTDKRQ